MLTPKTPEKIKRPHVKLKTYFVVIEIKNYFLMSKKKKKDRRRRNNIKQQRKLLTKGIKNTVKANKS